MYIILLSKGDIGGVSNVLSLSKLKSTMYIGLFALPLSFPKRRIWRVPNLFMQYWLLDILNVYSREEICWISRLLSPSKLPLMLRESQVYRIVLTFTILTRSLSCRVKIPDTVTIDSQDLYISICILFFKNSMPLRHSVPWARNWLFSWQTFILMILGYLCCVAQIFLEADPTYLIVLSRIIWSSLQLKTITNMSNKAHLMTDLHECQFLCLI